MTLTAQDQQIEAIRRQLEQMSRRLQFVEQPQDHMFLQIFIAKTDSGGIPAATATRASKATVTLQYIDDNDDYQDLLDDVGNPITVTAYNTNRTAIASTVSDIIQIKQEGGSGRLCADVEDCT